MSNKINIEQALDFFINNTYKKFVVDALMEQINETINDPELLKNNKQIILRFDTDDLAIMEYSPEKVFICSVLINKRIYDYFYNKGRIDFYNNNLIGLFSKNFNTETKERVYLFNICLVKRKMKSLGSLASKIMLIIIHTIHLYNYIDDEDMFLSFYRVIGYLLVTLND